MSENQTSEYSIGDIVKDKFGNESEITNLTNNSIELFIKKTSKLGIDCKQWFTIQEFKKKYYVV